jgi:hypothetical protein
MVKECSDPRTKVYAFVSTINKDKIWVTIKKWCLSKEIEFNGYTSIVDDEGTNILQQLINNLQRETPEVKEPKWHRSKKSIIMCDSDSDDEDEKPKRKYKYRTADYIIFLDDQSTELNNPAVTALFKKNRHFKSNVIIGNQYWNDLSTGARQNLDYMIIFGAQPKDKMVDIHRELDLSTPFEQFYEMYKFATKDRYNFLFIDIVNDRYRQNFNLEQTI